VLKTSINIHLSKRPQIVWCALVLADADRSIAIALYLVRTLATADLEAALLNRPLFAYHCIMRHPKNYIVHYVHARSELGTMSIRGQLILTH